MDQPHHPLSAIAENAVTKLRLDGESLVVAVQNLIEYWVVATRPQKDNGFGLSVDLATNEILRFQRMFEVLPETERILQEWERIVTTFRVSGKNAHDARFVAVMIVNRIDKILTFDVLDFARFGQIQVLDPRTVC